MAKGRVYFDIEIKHTDVHPHPIEPLIVKILKDFKMERQCIVSSFNPFAIRHIKKSDRNLSRAVIFGDFPDVPPVLRRGFGRWIAKFPQILKPNWRLLTGPHPMRFSPLFKVIPWTINDPIVAARMLAYKVEGMIGDDPTLLMDAAL
jgi:glycerophosphoryl diester phosphodiesterase